MTTTTTFTQQPRDGWKATYTVIDQDTVKVEVETDDGYVAPQIMRRYQAQDMWRRNRKNATPTPWRCE